MAEPTAASPDAGDLIYDWNEVGRRGRIIPQGITFFDETLRDGLQNPSVRDPSIEPKLKLLHLMDAIGIHGADIGLPGSSKRAFDDVLRMCREISDHRLKIRPAAAGRTVAADILPMVEIAQKSGIPVEVYTFIGSSAIRQLVEDWSLDLLAKRAAEAIDVGVKNGLPVAFVTEDTSRSRPEVLATLFKVAIDHGASRLCVCDTAGHATPDGVHNLISFTRSIIAGMGASGSVKIDWHGHNDRGLALVNAIYALEYGADRVHGTALGIGERVGNTPMELLLLNLKLLGQIEEQDLSRLMEYCRVAAEAVGWQVPINYPLVGRDAFRTATGVHASAIIKAQAKGDTWLADRIYSGVPAGMVGREQEIVVGFMSGASNASHALRRLGIEPTKERVDAVLRVAKETDHILSDDELRAAARLRPPMAADPCPCSSGKPYRGCCAPYHRGDRPAPTCEALMRSRYAAFALKQIDYLIATSHPDLIAREGSEAALRRGLAHSCATFRYPGLRVLDHREQGDEGQVLFLARVFRKGHDHGFVELSDFLRDDGRWRYLSGQNVNAQEIPPELLDSLTIASFTQAPSKTLA